MCNEEMKSSQRKDRDRSKREERLFFDRANPSRPGTGTKDLRTTSPPVLRPCAREQSKIRSKMVSYQHRHASKNIIRDAVERLELK